MAAAFPGVTRTCAGCASARGSRLEEPCHAPFNPPPFRLLCHLCSCSRDVRPATRAPAGCPSRLWLCLRVRPVGRWNPEELAFRPRGQADLPRLVDSRAHATCPSRRRRFRAKRLGFPCRLFGSGAIVRCRWAVARTVTGRARSARGPPVLQGLRWPVVHGQNDLGDGVSQGRVRDTGIAGPGWMKVRPDASFDQGIEKRLRKSRAVPRCLLGSQLARRPAVTEARIETPDPRQKAEVSMRPCRCKITARAFCTASTSSGVHSTSIATYFLARAPLEVRLPQTITRPF